MAKDPLPELLLNKSMALCAARELCRSEMRARLESWGAAPEVAVNIISRLVSEKFIDEERYSRAFVKDRFRQNGWGKVKIRASLRIKGIPDETVTEALGEIDGEKYSVTLKNLLETQRRKIRAKNQYELKGKLLRFGLSRGFESSLLYDILNDEF